MKMDSFTANNCYGETIEVKRNAAGNIVVVHSDYGPEELVLFTNGFHRWGLANPTNNSRLIISAEEEKIIDEGFIAVGGVLS